MPEIGQFLLSEIHSPLVIIGIVAFLGFYGGRLIKIVRLPTIIGYMLIGVILGPSLFDLIDETLQNNLSFIPDIALGFVALSIGTELSFRSLKRQGAGIIAVILCESFTTAICVTTAIYYLTHDIVLALVLGAISPASAPAGTVAVIQEYKAKGPLTKALYAVVAFDDGLGIIIFGFASAIAKSLLVAESGGGSYSILELLWQPGQEILFALLLGFILGYLFCFLLRRLSQSQDLFVLCFAFVFIAAGLCRAFHLSLILTNMVIGMMVVNTQSHSLMEKISRELTHVMPLNFILFFAIAGANLHIAALASLGLLGSVYIVTRMFGLISGAFLGATIGRMEDNIKKYLGLGILSQAGVAIGLSLIVKSEFSTISAHGLQVGKTVITTITATSVIFALIGPALTKTGLKKAGEIRGKGS